MFSSHDFCVKRISVQCQKKTIFILRRHKKLSNYNEQYVYFRVDIFIDVTIGTKKIAEQINRNLEGVLKPGNGASIQWSIGGVSEHGESPKSYELTENGALAATLMSLMLPGSPNVHHGDGNNGKSTYEHFSEPIDTKHMHTLPAMAWNTVPRLTEHDLNHSVQVKADDYDTIARMISLRDLSPSIYKNIVRKKDKYESNTSALYHENGNILILMRWYCTILKII